MRQPAWSGQRSPRVGPGKDSAFVALAAIATPAQAHPIPEAVQVPEGINTTGGRAPDTATCHAGTAGTTAEVPYTADYVFWELRD